MDLLADWTIRHGESNHLIQLLKGDLSRLPREHAVDILVVSAFPNDYIPTPSSLIGALYRRGISVEQLSRIKQLDLRDEYSCWLSYPVEQDSNFRQILCIESGWRGMPPEITDDLFRAVAPLFLTTFQNGSIALPIIGTGDQGWPAERMLDSILHASVSWLRRGLPIKVIKIVAFSDSSARLGEGKFVEVKEADIESRSGRLYGVGKKLHGPGTEGETYDVFVSYCHEDSDTAEHLVESIRRFAPNLRIFHDKKIVQPGQSWLMDIAESLDTARRVAALFTPHYWSSRYCKDEFSAALARQHDTGDPILFPIYVRSAKIPYLLRTLQYLDCREADLAKLVNAGKTLSKASA